MKPGRTKSNQGEPRETRENQGKPERTKGNLREPKETMENEGKPGRTKGNQGQPKETRKNQGENQIMHWTRRKVKQISLSPSDLVELQIEDCNFLKACQG